MGGSSKTGCSHVVQQGDAACADVETVWVDSGAKGHRGHPAGGTQLGLARGRMVGSKVLERTRRQLSSVHGWRVVPPNKSKRLENEERVRVLQRNRTEGDT